MQILPIVAIAVVSFASVLTRIVWERHIPENKKVFIVERKAAWKVRIK